MAYPKLILLCTVLAFSAACSQPLLKAPQPTLTHMQSSSAPTADAVVDSIEEDDVVAQSSLPKQALTADFLFKFLVAEVAGQRGAIGIAQSTYLDLARETRDPRIARRAVEVAMFARNDVAALEASRLWAASDMESGRAQQTLAALLLSAGNLAEAEPILRDLLKQDAANGFLHLSSLMGKLRDSQEAFEVVQRLAADYPALPEAYLAVAQAAFGAGLLDEAVISLQQADKLRPGWEPAALLHVQIIGKSSRADAMDYMRAFLVTYPEAREIRLAYARALVNDNRFNEVRAEFARLTTDFPRNADVSFAAGLLSLQIGDLEVARGLLTRTLEYDARDPDAVQYYLGQVAEQMKQPDTAMAHYLEVGTGNFLVPARARQAALLARAGRHDEAQAVLAATRGGNDAQNVRLIQAQAELLRENKDHVAAFDVLSEGLKRYPDTADLLYDRAMAAEKLGKLDLLEADLRRVIVLRPDDAQAYNALGYTLVDRTDRLAEAIVLLDKALSLAPQDPFILDSVGWAQYRSGNLARAQEILERAYMARPDPEIAAHLGEVMWARGQRDAAGVLWQTGLQAHPHNELLLETVRRLKP